ncbi:MAG: winged helix-turn-helix transcriptional regulator, partial [Halobacteriales archaeon]|nr:winged helix-turn-helix transcriptional regulator [Halobacteriales archaeon]
PQPDAPEAQGTPQSGTVEQARSTVGGAQAQAEAQAHATQDQAVAQSQSAQQQAAQQLQGLQAEADKAVAMVPKDPVGFAAGAAQGAAGQAAQSLPSVFADPTMEPQAGEAQVVAPDAGLLPPILAGSLLVAGAAGATFFAFWLAGSSGTVASGAAAAKSTELRRLLPFASPLFTRFEKETVLGHPRREALYALILQQPGISLQSLGESTGLSRTAVLHHLRLLEMQHLIVSKRMGRSRHYYENGGRYGRDAKEAYAILQNARSKEVAEFIRTHPGTMQKQLCAALAIQPSIAHWHVRRLQAAQLVDCVRQGRAVNYFPGRGLLEVAAQAPIPPMQDLPEMPAPAPAPLAAVPSAFPSA